MAAIRASPRRPDPARRAIARTDLARWAAFSVAALIFIVDATTTVAVLGLRPDAVELNPIARWTLTAHPTAPYLLKAAVIAECAVACAMARAMRARWAAWVMVASMAAAGVAGIASALATLIA